jgi:hypothetical protein
MRAMFSRGMPEWSQTPSRRYAATLVVAPTTMSCGVVAHLLERSR